MWGVGRIIMKLLENLSYQTNLQSTHRFVLYFKDSIPDFSFLDSPIFEKKIVSVPFFKGRLFPIYYYLLLPIRLWFANHDVMFWPNYMLPIIAFGKSHVMLTEDIYHESHEGKLPFRYRLAYLIFGWWTAKRATKILAISEASKQNVTKLYKIKSDRITVNHLGIDIGNDWDLKNHKLKTENYILYVGQAFPRRHLKETMEAFAMIANDFPELNLIAVGPDKYETATIAPLIDKLNHHLGRPAISHHNYVTDDELISMYAHAKAIVYVSEREAFGLPPLEGLAYGVPPIVADTPLSHELFGNFAIYSYSTKAEDIAKAMRLALTNKELRVIIKEKGPSHSQKYSWSAFTDRWLITINSLCKN